MGFFQQKAPVGAPPTALKSPRTRPREKPERGSGDCPHPPKRAGLPAAPSTRSVLALLSPHCAAPHRALKPAPRGSRGQAPGGGQGSCSCRRARSDLSENCAALPSRRARGAAPRSFPGGPWLVAVARAAQSPSSLHQGALLRREPGLKPRRGAARKRSPCAKRPLPPAPAAGPH